MLHLILGRAGSGKTMYMRQRAKASLQEAPERPVYYIVPEQFSFETERAMLQLLGARQARKIHVLSFSRLADEVFRQYGGAAGRRLEDGGRCIFMSLALEQTKEQLDFYRRKAENTEMIGMLLETAEELKRCAVSPEKLEQAAQKLPEGTLRRKTVEISRILMAYDALVAESCVDPLDDLSRIPDVLVEKGFFKGSLVLLDSFASFTVQEYGILRIMLQQADHVEISLCADSPQDQERGVGLFSLVQQTASHVKRMAKENDVPVAPYVYLPAGVRYASNELKALEASVYRPQKAGVSTEEEPSVVIYRGADLFDEGEFAAATIRNLVIEKGYRYRDFAVVARSTAPYAVLLEEAFSSRDIPFFLDDPRPMENEPLMRMVLAALQAVRFGWRTEDLLLVMKTGLLPFSEEAIARMENYAYLWSVNREEWETPFTKHPRGFQEEWTEQDRRQLQALEEDRNTLMGPLKTLRGKLKEASGEDCARALYHLLDTWQVSRYVKEMADRLEQLGQGDLEQRLLRSWDILMEVLDQCALVMGKFVPGILRFTELLRLVISSARIASIPQKLDQVTISSADRMRLENPKVVILLGARQGEFPAAMHGEGIFSGMERRELIGLGIPLNETLIGSAVQERFLAYTALSLPSQRLYITYSGAGEGGEPSSLIMETEAVLPGIPHWREETLPPLYLANSKPSAFGAAARNFGKNTPFSAALEQYFRQDPDYGKRFSALDKVASPAPKRFENEETSKALFGEQMLLSPTQVETFHLCRFQYFCRYGLGVKEERAAEMDALEYGSIMHYLLEQTFRNTDAETLAAMSRQEMEDLVQKLLDRYTQEKLGGRENKNARFLWMLDRLIHAAATILAHVAEELAQSEFVPVDFELEVGASGIPPLTIPLPEGSVSVQGKIDRVDLFRQNGEQYLRIIDYKTGKKDFRLSDVIYGVNMQMLLYLAALWETGAARYGGPCVPAGILYVPASDPRISVSHKETAEKVLSQRKKALRMKGLLVDDPSVLTAMESKGEGQYIPVTLKNGAPSRRDSVVTQWEMEKILEKVRETVRQMAEELQKGHVETIPLSGDSYNACQWCPYGAVCGREDSQPQREMKSWDREEVLKELCGKEES